MMMGYLAGFEAALHVAICGSGGPDVVKMLAMSMDQDIHDGATPFHDLAEDLLAAIKQAMLITAVSSEDIDFGVKGFVIDATGKTPEEVSEEIRLRAAGLVAKMMPKKDARRCLMWSHCCALPCGDGCSSRSLEGHSIQVRRERKRRELGADHRVPRLQA